MADPVSIVGRAFLRLWDSVVTILVGKTQTPFQIHKGLLCSKSTYFQAAFNGSFKEATDGSIHLIDEDPDMFQYYVLWVYNQNFQKDIEDDDCFYLYLMADKFGSEALQNLIMDTICDRCHNSNYDCGESGQDKVAKQYKEYPVRPKTINFVYDNTLPGSVLRSVLVDRFAWNEVIHLYPELVDTPPEFLFDTLKACARRLPMRLDDEVAPFEQEAKCEVYHIHKNGSPCKK
ncbi:MAG: hypothetical protein Q9220_006498 [cf. Caloplaca sp. 1 TL-2023]